MSSYNWSKSKVYKYVLDHMHDGCCSPWPFAIARGYAKIRIPRNGRENNGLLIVARLVCELTHGPAPKERPIVRHLCGKGNAGCFNARCVVWGDKYENHADMRRHGTLLTCEKHNMAKLTWNDIRSIRSRQGRVSYSDLAKEFHVCVGTISIIQQNRTWRDPEFHPLPKGALMHYVRKRAQRR